MKKIFTIFALIALANLSVASFSFGGEVKKQPLQLEERAELSKQQSDDHPEIRNVTAGITNGYGLVQLAAIIGVGYLTYDQLTDDD